MTVYVDELVNYERFRLSPRVRRAGATWCHMLADSSEELHAFAKRIGLKRAWAQKVGQVDEHYDLVPSKREEAVRQGAVEITRREGGRMVNERIEARETAKRRGEVG